MPSTLPVSLAQRVFSAHPAPIAEAVWALETAGSPADKRQCLQVAARSLLRFVAAIGLAARLQRGDRSDGKRARELVRDWRVRVLTDAEWLDLLRELLRAPPSDLPLPRLGELVQGADGARFIVAIKGLLTDDPARPLEESINQLIWLLERLDPVWADAHLVVPRTAPADGSARQPVTGLSGVADASPFEERELAPHVRMPADRPLLVTAEGKPRVSLHPVVQWLHDVPGVGEGLFFLEGCDGDAELFRAYPTQMELRHPRPKEVVAAEKDARALSRVRSTLRNRVILIVFSLVAIGIVTQRYLADCAQRAAEEARLQALKQAQEREQTLEDSWAVHAKERMAQVQQTLRQRRESIVGELHRTGTRQAEVQRLTEALRRSDTPTARRELLDVRASNRPITWRSFPAHGCAAMSPAGDQIVVANRDGSVDWYETATGKSTRHEDAKGARCDPLAIVADAPHAGDAGPVDQLVESPDRTRVAWLTDDLVHTQAADAKRPPTTGRHTAPIRDVAFSPDSKRLATASEDGTVRVWDAVDGRELKIFGKDPASQYVSVAFTPDQKTLAGSTAAGVVRFWSATTGVQEHALKLTAPVLRMAFLGDPRSLVIAQPTGTSVIDAQSGDVIVSLDGSFPEKGAFHVSADGRWILVSDGNEAVRLWDMKPADRTLLPAHMSLGASAFSPDGRSVATAGGDITLWSLRGDPPTRWDGHLTADQLGFATLTFSPDARSVAAISPSCVTAVWDADTGHETKRFTKGSTCPNPQIAWSPDGADLAVSSSEHAVTLFDVTSGAELWSKAQSSPVTSMVFSPDGLVLVTVQGDVAQWNVVNGREIRRSPVAGVKAVAFSPDGKALVEAGNEVTVMGTGIVASFEPVPDELEHVAFSPGGESLFGSTAHGVWWWDAATGRLRGKLPRVTESVPSLSISPDGAWVLAGDHAVPLPDSFGPEERTIPMSTTAVAIAASANGGLAIAGKDGTIHVIDSGSGQESKQIKAPLVMSLALRADGALVASGGDRKIHQWDLPSGAPDASPAGGRRSQEATGGIAFVGDNVAVVVGNVVEIRSPRTGEVLKELKGHTGTVTAIDASRSRSQVVTASQDGTFKLWNADSGEQVAEIRPPIGSPSAVACASDRDAAVFGRDDGQIMLRDGATNGTWFQAHEGAVRALAFVGENLLLSAGADGTLRLWQLNDDGGKLTVTQILVLNDDDPVVSISPETGTVTTAGGGVIRVWNVAALRSFLAASPSALSRDSGT